MEIMSKMSLFMSQSANQAGYVIKAIFLLKEASTDPGEIARINTLLKKYESTKTSFAYNCLNKKSPLHELTPYPYDLCDFPDLELKGPKSSLIYSHYMTMLMNISEHLKNWHIYQKLAIKTQRLILFGLYRDKKADRKRLRDINSWLLLGLRDQLAIQTAPPCG